MAVRGQPHQPAEEVNAADFPAHTPQGYSLIKSFDTQDLRPERLAMI
jgi:hypothetical protein